MNKERSLYIYPFYITSTFTLYNLPNIHISPATTKNIHRPLLGSNHKHRRRRRCHFNITIAVRSPNRRRLVVLSFVFGSL